MMPLWVILTLTSLAVVLLGLLVAGTVYFVRKSSSTRGDYYTQVSHQGRKVKKVSRSSLVTGLRGRLNPRLLLI